MPTRTVLFPAGFRPIAVPVITLAVCAALLGFWPLTGAVTALLPIAAVPSAAGLPFLLAPLRAVPMVGGTIGFWAADNLGALLMLFVAALSLTASLRKRPRPGVWRTLGSAVWATVLGVIAGNILRAVYASFVMQSDFGTYLGQIGFGVIVSALTGLVFGLLVGAVAVLARPLWRHRRRGAVAPGTADDRARADGAARAETAATVDA